MTWNYRRLMTESGYAIHEVYYDEQGDIEMWSDNPISPHGVDEEELKQDIIKMRTALTKPVLVEDGDTLKEI